MDNRLKKIAETIGIRNRIIDVGTDHGYLPVYLIEKGYVNEAIVSDISKDSLRKAEILVKDKHLENKIKTRLGSGLEVISEKDAIDLAIIAGMGGNLIAKIIEERKELMIGTGIDLVLQPMQNPEVLRRYLIDSGYCIDGEFLVEEDGRIYQIITAKFGSSEQHYEFWDFYFGRSSNYQSDEQKNLYHLLLKKKYEEIKAILSKLVNTSVEHRTVYFDYKAKLAMIEEMLSNLDIVTE